MARRLIRALLIEFPEDPPVDQLLQLLQNSLISLWVSNSCPSPFALLQF
jgi:hypothetical protein